MIRMVFVRMYSEVQNIEIRKAQTYCILTPHHQVRFQDMSKKTIAWTKRV